MWIPNLADPAILTAGIEEATRWPEQWTDGGTIEAYEDLRRLAYGIGWRALTNESVHDQRPVVYEALAAGDAWLGRLVHPLGTLRWRLPTPEGRRGHRLRRELDTPSTRSRPSVATASKETTCCVTGSAATTRWARPTPTCADR